MALSRRAPPQPRAMLKKSAPVPRRSPKESIIKAGGKKMRASACADLPGAEGTVLLAFAVEPFDYPK